MSSNLIQNGDFEQNPLSNSGWGLFETIPGWTSPTGVIEIQEGVRSAGNAVVELDSNANAVIEQIVTIPSAGTYRFSFDYARNGAADTNGFEVFINGVSQGVVSPSATGWFTYTLDIALPPGPATIQIAARGTSDAVGTFIDNVSLVLQGPPVPNVAPVISSNGAGDDAAVSVAENTAAVTTVTVTDPDGPGRTFALSGADAARFQIDQATGALTFVSAPNFEGPTDQGTDNVYNVTVTVNDGAGGSDAQNLAVTVTNVSEPPPPPPSTNFIRNGDFEQNTLNNNGWGIFETIPEWTSPIGRIEVQEGNFGFGSPQGNGIVELDSDGNSAIEQTVTLTAAGSYRFSLDYIMRGTDPSTNGFEVFVNGVSRGIVNPTTPGRQTFTVDLTLAAGDNVIRIAARGNSMARAR